MKTLFVLFAIVAVYATKFDDALNKMQEKADKNSAATCSISEFSLKTDGSKRLSPNFKVSEFACQDKSDKVVVGDKLAELLQRVRDFYGAGISLLNAYHSENYQSANSCGAEEYHKKGIAADFKVTGYKPAEIVNFLEAICDTCGIGLYDSFVHLDTRGTKKLWKGKTLSEVDTFWTGVPLTSEQLRKMFPKVSGENVTAFTEYLNSAFRLASVNTKRRMAHFLGQVGHESGGLTTFTEWYSGRNAEAYFNKKYGSRKDLGNTVTTDGYKYRGRGPIQVTGKANYNLCGKALGLDLVSNPDLLANPKYGFNSAAWFWAKRKINTYADADNITTVTKRINGGTNGLADRKTRTTLAKKVLGA